VGREATGGEVSVRARRRFEALDAALYDPRRRRYRAAPGSRRSASLWPFTTAWSAAASLAALVGEQATHLASFEEGLAAYRRCRRPLAASRLGYRASPRGIGGPIFSDDNAWVALARLAEHATTGARATLERAEASVAFVLAGWRSCATPVPGGIVWQRRPLGGSRNTCATAPAACAAARLALLGRGARYREWAERLVNWVEEACGRTDGLYADRVESDGRRVDSIFSYNQGAMIGAGALLSELTGERAYVERAERAAAATLARGVADLVRQPVAFNAVLLRNLLLLDAMRPDPAYRRFVLAYYAEVAPASADSLLAHGRDWLNPTAALVQIEALLAGAPPQP